MRRSSLQTITDLLDWTLLPALVLAIPSALIGAKLRGSQGALAFAILGAFAGATLGSIGWAAWEVGKRKGLFFAVIAGPLTGLIVSTTLRAIYEPIPGLIAGVKEEILGKMVAGLMEWVCSALPAVSALGVAVGLAVGAVARRIRRRDARSAGGKAGME
jgi:hypothetical protein